MMCRGIAVMRRRADSYLNATQILKVAGIEKGRRTKILEKDVAIGIHEKVQGGYGKYQGTWIPFERGVELARHYGVESYMKPILDFDPETTIAPNKTPARSESRPRPQPQPTVHHMPTFHSYGPAALPPPPQIHMHSLNTSPPLPPELLAAAPVSYLPSHYASVTPSPLHTGSNTPGRMSPSFFDHTQPNKKQRTGEYNIHQGAYFGAPGYFQVPGGFLPPGGQIEPVQQQAQEVNGMEKHRTVLMAIFLTDDPNHVPELLTNPNPPSDLDLDLVIDDQGHTSLHWAAALARINILKLLVDRGATVTKTNLNGETALMRSVLVTNNFDNQTFPQLLEILSSSIPVKDSKNRTVLHHLALTSGLKGRLAPAKYYLSCLLEHVTQTKGVEFFKDFVDIQDKNGDTALNIAARVGCKSLVNMLVEVGASKDVENNVGIKPEDFGVGDDENADENDESTLNTDKTAEEKVGGQN